RCAGGGGDGLDGDFELADRVFELARLLYASVGAGSDDDLCLTLCVDVDERDPGRTNNCLELERDAGLSEARERLLGKGIRADGADHRHIGAEPCRSDRLVRALAAREALEARIGDGLARLRQALAARDEVEVDAADDR